MSHFSTKTIFAAAALFVADVPCFAETLNLTATLKGSETPPDATAGAGKLTGTYDTDAKSSCGA